MSIKWICVLHFYQPPFQKPSILNQIVNECYLPLTQMLVEKKEDFCIYININQSLIEQLIANGHAKVIENIKALIKMKKVRLTLTPSFHPILPLISKDIVIQQVTDNLDTLKTLFKFSDFDLFFPPELAYDPNSNLNSLPVLLSQGALASDEYVSFVKYKNKKFIIRQNDLSNMLMGGQIKSFKNINKLNFIDKNGYFVTAVDAETFGHHRKGYITNLEALLNEVNTVFISDSYTKVDCLNISSWSSLKGQKPFILWKDEKNELHKKLWKFADFAKKNIKTNKDKLNFYKGISSCTFWWASANPWWSIEMLERGAWQIYKALSVSNLKVQKQAYERYSDIVLLAFKWQREGVIDKKFEIDETKTVPFSKRCKKGEFETYINKFEQAEKQAVAEKNYELAIKWRDAITKLKNNTDQYDNWHVVDQLRNYQ